MQQNIMQLLYFHKAPLLIMQLWLRNNIDFLFFKIKDFIVRFIRYSR